MRDAVASVSIAVLGIIDTPSGCYLHPLIGSVQWSTEDAFQTWHSLRVEHSSDLKRVERTSPYCTFKQEFR